MAINHPVGLTLTVEVFWDNAIWYDITADVRSMELRTCRRGSEGLIFEPGSLTLVLNNNARKYDPLYSSGTYFGDLTPGRQVRVFLDSASAPQTQVWRGWTDRFFFSYDRSNNDSTTTITCIDALAIAALGVVPVGVTPGVQPGDDVAERLAQIEAVANE